MRVVFALLTRRDTSETMHCQSQPRAQAKARQWMCVSGQGSLAFAPDLVASVVASLDLQADSLKASPSGSLKLQDTPSALRKTQSVGAIE